MSLIVTKQVFVHMVCQKYPTHHRPLCFKVRWWQGHRKVLSPQRYLTHELYMFDQTGTSPQVSRHQTPITVPVAPSLFRSILNCECVHLRGRERDRDREIMFVVGSSKSQEDRWATGGETLSSETSCQRGRNEKWAGGSGGKLGIRE